MRWAIGIIVAVVLAGIFGPQFFYTVDETQFVVITRFGEIRRVETQPGLKAKLPFIDTVIKLDKRLLRIDVRPASMPDRESQFLEIDAYVRYRIVDPREFRQTLVDEVTAASTIGQIVIDELRREIGLRDRSEIIGGLIEIDADGRALKDEEGRNVVRALTEEGIPVRERITRLIRDRTDSQAQEKDWGIRIEDVHIKRADFPLATEENVFARMRSERDVQAQRLRAEGEEEFLSITAKVNRDVEVIAAEADETANVLRGEGEGEAIGILAAALGQDPEFFAFRRSLEAYKAFLVGRSTVVLSADSPLFQYLQSPAIPEPTPESP